MSSPFTFFRSNQHILMVGIVILSMLAFTLDAVFSQQGSHFVMLGVLMGGILFAFAGIGTGRWFQYGIGGALLGALCGWILPEAISPASEMTRTSTLGVFNEKRFSELMLQRNIANAFMQQAFEKSIGPGMGRFAPQFQFYSDSVEDDLMFGELMRAEAVELGIAVTDSMVSDYINKRTDEKLTAKDFAEIRSNLNFGGRSVSEDELFDAFRAEIQALMAFQHLTPHFASMPQGPEVYFELFRRTRVSQRLNTVRLDVDAFLSEVGEPTEAEIATLFADNRLKFPGSDAPGSPGFRQEPKAKLGYVELSYKTAEQTVTPPTDQEIEAYYNENKETLYRKPAEPTPDEPTPPGTTPEASTSSEPKPAEPGAAPSADGNTPPSDAPKPEASAPDASGAKPSEVSAPAGEPKPAQEPKPEASNTEASGDAPKSPDAPQEVPKPENPVPANPEQPKAEQPKTDGAQSRFSVSRPILVSYQPQEPATPATPDPAATPAQDPAPAAAPVDAAAANAEPPAAAAPAGNAPPAAADIAPEAAQTAPGTPPANPPATDAKQDDSSAAPDAKPEFVIPKVEYRPLDDDLKNEIRDRLLDEKVRAAIEQKMTAIMADLKALEKQRSGARKKIVDADPDIEDVQLFDKMREHAGPMIDGMKEIARKHGATYVETPLLTYSELYEGESYPVGAASDPSENPFMQSGPNVAQQVFQVFPSTPGDDTNLFSRHRSVKNAFDLDGGESHFAWWTIEYSVSHVPNLEDPGIRDQVILAWKRIKARDVAKKRGEELASLVRAGLGKPEAERKDMSASLEGQTLLGKPDSPAVAVRQTQSFSWMEQSMTPQMNFNQRPTLRRSAVRFADEAGGSVRSAGDQFMKAVFEDVGNEEVGVVTNDDLSSYFVVQPVERSADDEVLRQQFMTEGKFGFRNASVSSLLSAVAGTPAAMEWERSVWKKYGVDRDTLPSE